MIVKATTTHGLKAEGLRAKPALTREEYLEDPCAASALPFWKTEQVEVPTNISIFREDEFDKENSPGTDEPYFKLIHHLRRTPHPVLPDEYKLTSTDAEELANHIRECYLEERIAACELASYAHRDVHDDELWIAIRDRATGRVVASGIGEFDTRIGEGVLDWIQVSPDYRRRGLGRAVVCEMLRRLSKKAGFVTVSGRLDNPDNPFALYRACGFTHPVLWHVVTGTLQSPHCAGKR